MPETPDLDPHRPVLDSIRIFLDAWPEAEFGPAHIVLSDDNLEDGHVRWCLGLAHAALSGNVADLTKPGDAALMAKVDWYRRHDRRELAATIVFLEQLLTVPEADRVAEAEKNVMPEPPDFTQLVADVADAFSCDSHLVGSPENRSVAARVAQLWPHVDGLHPDTAAHIVATVLDDVLHLDTDDAGVERIAELVTRAVHGAKD